MQTCPMLILKANWFGNATAILEQIKEFETHDQEVEMNELLLMITFLLHWYIFIFKK